MQEINVRRTMNEGGIFLDLNDQQKLHISNNGRVRKHFQNNKNAIKNRSLGGLLALFYAAAINETDFTVVF